MSVGEFEDRLRRNGFELVRTGKHRIWRGPGNGIQITVPSTPSDRRWVKNAEAQLERYLDQVWEPKSEKERELREQLDEFASNFRQLFELIPKAERDSWEEPYARKFNTTALRWFIDDITFAAGRRPDTFWDPEPLERALGSVEWWPTKARGFFEAELGVLRRLVVALRERRALEDVKKVDSPEPVADKTAAISSEEAEALLPIDLVQRFERAGYVEVLGDTCGRAEHRRWPDHRCPDQTVRQEWARAGFRREMVAHVVARLSTARSVLQWDGKKRALGSVKEVNRELEGWPQSIRAQFQTEVQSLRDLEARLRG